MAHLTLEQRYTIECMHKKGYKQKDISQAINKDKSVVSRELKRNCDLRNNAYLSSLAQQKYTKRQKEKPRKRYFTSEISEGIPLGKAYIDDKLYQKFSPEQIVRGDAFPWERHPLGEIDTIIGKNHQKAILTINDRVTGQLLMKKPESKNADQLAKATIELPSPMKHRIKTITADNGKEFAPKESFPKGIPSGRTEHQKIAEKLGIDFFFAHPYHSWERGSNENLNGLIRQYIPKKTDFNNITDQYIQFVQDELNNRLPP